jgi:hypothetical protein
MSLQVAGSGEEAARPSTHESSYRKQALQLKRLLAEKMLEVDFFKGALQRVEARRQRQLRPQEALRNLLPKPLMMTGESSALGLKLNRPGETEAGSAGKQPCRGITRWGHRDEEVGGASFAPHPFPTLPPDLIPAIDPQALKIPAPRAECL